MVQIWSRNSQSFGATKSSNATVWPDMILELHRAGRHDPLVSRLLDQMFIVVVIKIHDLYHPGHSCGDYFVHLFEADKHEACGKLL